MEVRSGASSCAYMAYRRSRERFVPVLAEQGVTVRGRFARCDTALNGWIHRNVLAAHYRCPSQDLSADWAELIRRHRMCCHTCGIRGMGSGTATSVEYWNRSTTTSGSHRYGCCGRGQCVRIDARCLWAVAGAAPPEGGLVLSRADDAKRFASESRHGSSVEKRKRERFLYLAPARTRHGIVSQPAGIPSRGRTEGGS